MVEQAAIVTEARRWLGTPYVHQCSLRGVGCDCLGLVRGIWRAFHGAEPGPVPPYSADWGEVDGSEPLARACWHFLRPVPLKAAAPGTVLLFRMRAGGPAKHLGIHSEVGQQPAFIHAYQRRGVTESPLSAPWAARLVARFAFPERSV